MKTEKIDLRVRYTKALLKKALVELMRENPISKISVKSLCETANINRSTFYLHYTDQYDLLHQVLQEVIAELKKHISYDDALYAQTSRKLQAMNQMLDYIAKNADLFIVLLSENGDRSFQTEIMLLAQKKIISDLREEHTIDVRVSEYLQGYIITGPLSIVQKWLQDGMLESTEKMTELISNLLYKGLSAFGG
jgi:AcrR family transcriptional regulator